MDKIARIASFEKVSYKEFANELKKLDNMPDNCIRYLYDRIIIPSRATEGSAGYDFYMPISTALRKGKWTVVPTGIRCNVSPGWMLMCCPKSGLGFKHRIKLANTIGVIDSDYYFSSNEGHIMTKISTEEKVHLVYGTKFMQAIFLPYGITMDDSVVDVRDGGFGSTGR